MRIPIIRGVIDRRVLANFRIDAEVMQRQLPAPFRPKLVRNYAIGGICLIRLKAIRPRFFPWPFGFGSENAAHRIAVEWQQDGLWRSGVYVPRRDTSSRLNTFFGGTLFPGIQHHATFDVTESPDHVSIRMNSDDGSTHVHVSGQLATQLPASSVFASAAEASDFFQAGSMGYSDSSRPDQFQGMELRCEHWSVEPLRVEHVESSYFDAKSRFPAGSVEFDCALLMRDLHHEWHELPELCCAAGAGT